VYAPNSKGGAHANPERYPEEAVWETDGELVRAAYTLRSGDGDFNQANDLVNKVMDDAARDRLVNNIVGHVSDGVEEPVLSRVFEYWKNVDQTIGERVEQGVMANRRENGQ
jgi:catalase